MKIFEKINLFLLIIIYSFIELKVLTSLPKNVHGPLDNVCIAVWPAGHAIDHISIQLNRLTMQLVFNEV